MQWKILRLTMTHFGQLKEMDMIDYSLMTMLTAIFVITFSLGVSTIFLCVDLYKRLKKRTEKPRQFVYSFKMDLISREQRVA